MGCFRQSTQGCRHECRTNCRISEYTRTFVNQKEANVEYFTFASFFVYFQYKLSPALMYFGFHSYFIEVKYY